MIGPPRPEERRMTDAQKLHTLSTVMLALGFISLATLFLASVFAPEGGGVPIGLGLLVPLAVGGGLGGLVLVLGVIAFVLGLRLRRPARRVDA
jgi:hypothetical protein